MHIPHGKGEHRHAFSAFYRLPVQLVIELRHCQMLEFLHKASDLTWNGNTGEKLRGLGAQLPRDADHLPHMSASPSILV